MVGVNVRRTGRPGRSSCGPSTGVAGGTCITGSVLIPGAGAGACWAPAPGAGVTPGTGAGPDRKSTRLNSSHLVISYAVFCLKKKTIVERLDSDVVDFQ